jgi:hypothetical protein
MAITFPLTLPDRPGFKSAECVPISLVGLSRSPTTGEKQTFVWPGQWLEFMLALPPMRETRAAIWSAFFLTCRSASGTFYFTPPNRVTTAGTKAGAVTVGAGAVAGDTVLPISGGTGEFAIGDYLQVGALPTPKLHRVIKLNAGSVDVFPVLRSAYANGTAITYVNPVGLFSLSDQTSEAYDDEIICNGIDFKITEAL